MADHNTYDHLSGQLWKDENFDIASYRATGASPPDVITIPGTGIETVSFDGAGTMEEIHVCKELNHDYREGTPLAFHVHWYPTSTAAGNVKWQIQYYIASHMSATVISGTMSVVQAAGGVAWQPQTAVFPDLNLGSASYIMSQIHFHFFRDPTDAEDTYAADAAVATMGYHYATNSRGSSTRTSK